MTIVINCFLKVMSGSNWGKLPFPEEVINTSNFLLESTSSANDNADLRLAASSAEAAIVKLHKNVHVISYYTQVVRTTCDNEVTFRRQEELSREVFGVRSHSQDPVRRRS